MYIKAKTINDAFVKGLTALKTEGVESGPRGFKTKEIIGMTIEIEDVINDVEVNNQYHKLSQKYLNNELKWYGDMGPLSQIAEHAPFWNTLYEDKETLFVNSNYGYRIRNNSFFTGKESFDQFEHITNLLMEDNDSRRAVINIKLPDNFEDREGVNDTPCTLSLQFFIRDGKLDMIVNMRSNDIIYGFPYDAYYFTYLQLTLATRLKVKPGKYIHNAGSFHIYEKHWHKMEKK